jgi:hypothetical protein
MFTSLYPEQDEPITYLTVQSNLDAFIISQSSITGLSKRSLSTAFIIEIVIPSFSHHSSYTSILDHLYSFIRHNWRGMQNSDNLHYLVFSNLPTAK